MEMGFIDEEKQAMLQIKGVGATVISRLEQIGFERLADLRGQEAIAITRQISDMMGSTCWHNSPQARSAIQAIVDLANSR
jgi:hypothetical protein